MTGFKFEKLKLKIVTHVYLYDMIYLIKIFILKNFLLFSFKYSNNNEPIPIQGIPCFKYDLFNDPFW